MATSTDPEIVVPVPAPGPIGPIPVVPIAPGKPSAPVAMNIDPNVQAVLTSMDLADSQVAVIAEHLIQFDKMNSELTIREKRDETRREKKIQDAVALDVKRAIAAGILSQNPMSNSEIKLLRYVANKQEFLLCWTADGIKIVDKYMNILTSPLVKDDIIRPAFALSMEIARSVWNSDIVKQNCVVAFAAPCLDAVMYCVDPYNFSMGRSLVSGIVSCAGSSYFRSNGTGLTGAAKDKLLGIGFSLITSAFIPGVIMDNVVWPATAIKVGCELLPGGAYHPYAIAALNKAKPIVEVGKRVIPPLARVVGESYKASLITALKAFRSAVESYAGACGDYKEEISLEDQSWLGMTGYALHSIKDNVVENGFSGLCEAWRDVEQPLRDCVPGLVQVGALEVAENMAGKATSVFNKAVNSTFEVGKSLATRTFETSKKITLPFITPVITIAGKSFDAAIRIAFVGSESLAFAADSYKRAYNQYLDEMKDTYLGDPTIENAVKIGYVVLVGTFGAGRNALPTGDELRPIAEDGIDIVCAGKNLVVAGCSTAKNLYSSAKIPLSTGCSAVGKFAVQQYPIAKKLVTGGCYLTGVIIVCPVVIGVKGYPVVRDLLVNGAKACDTILLVTTGISPDDIGNKVKDTVLEGTAKVVHSVAKGTGIERVTDAAQDQKDPMRFVYLVGKQLVTRLKEPVATSKQIIASSCNGLGKLKKVAEDLLVEHCMPKLDFESAQPQIEL